MAMLHVLRVFTADDATGGNPLGVFLEGGSVEDAARQAIAAELGFSETVFVDDRPGGRVRIYTPTVELGFAGHPLVGTAWLLAREGQPVETLQPPAGAVPTWQDEGGRTWIRGRAEWAPPMALREFPSPADVEALDGPPDDLGFVDTWSWLDEEAGVVRSRVFAPEAGVAEDEATGAAAVRLVTELGRAITILQGRGSVLHARPGPDGTAEIGGLVALEDVREH